MTKLSKKAQDVRKRINEATTDEELIAIEQNMGEMPLTDAELKRLSATWTKRQLQIHGDVAMDPQTQALLEAQEEGQEIPPEPEIVRLAVAPETDD
jgi:hypothetical protein